MCDCPVCTRIRKVSDIARDLNYADKEVITNLLGDYLSADEDNSYYHCILNGSWPNAEQILERALKRIKDKGTSE